MSNPTILSPADLGAAYAALEDSNHHHEAALLVARVSEDAAAVDRLTEIKAIWERGAFTGELSRERYDISSPLFKALVASGRMMASGRMIYPPKGWR